MAKTEQAARRYRVAGVDEQAAARLARHAMRAAKGQDPAGYAATVPLPAGKGLLLAAGCDGAGSKPLLLRAHGRLEVAGWDLVAACVNDLACAGAKPWLFFDALSCHRLDAAEGKQILRGITAACKAAGCSLAGGEIAQLPEQLRPGAWDLTGFALGLAEKKERLPRRGIRAGDVLLGLPAEHPHANGYSLVRRILRRRPQALRTRVGGRSLKSILLAPTPLYVPLLARLLQSADGKALRAAMHVTGGGLRAAAARGLPAGLGARIETGSWETPPVYGWLAQAGRVSEAEMLEVFNCGVGMVCCAAAAGADALRRRLRRLGCEARVIGTVKKGAGVEFV
ncbi:MAG: phosphoribosylformylglycinamidine cyclo-ligase [Betaproteobacteria bacterium AqS2]|uniref:Phosphoribosylformylglycinamidine cyclo-ligase n=1 Tax=Candidatus Amphirhobacter heronislandensis TaxID=1732024 RepID=A0A930XW35_9GAMM|nr:phosphoribosylformylglycinamidine cyclo-ligase [Betaproteobacteria bacterium AqS2]